MTMSEREGRATATSRIAYQLSTSSREAGLIGVRDFRASAVQVAAKRTLDSLGYQPRINPFVSTDAQTDKRVARALFRDMMRDAPVRIRDVRALLGELNLDVNVEANDAESLDAFLEGSVTPDLSGPSRFWTADEFWVSFLTDLALMVYDVKSKQLGLEVQLQTWGPNQLSYLWPVLAGFPGSKSFGVGLMTWMISPYGSSLAHGNRLNGGLSGHIAQIDSWLKYGRATPPEA